MSAARDNLSASIHMIVEAVFGFHPLVWWIGVRLVDERERACDEDVLRLGNERHVYAEAILNVCKYYLESPLVCVSGITGSDLKETNQCNHGSADCAKPQPCQEAPASRWRNGGGDSAHRHGSAECARRPRAITGIIRRSLCEVE